MHESPYEESFTPDMMKLIAQSQAELFEYADIKGLDMHVFIREYMKSTFCNQEMDSDCSYFHFKPDTVLYAYVEKECSLTMKGESENICNPGWVGWMYRMLVYKLDIASSEIVDVITPERLDELAISYELFDSEDAVREVAKIAKEIIERC